VTLHIDEIKISNKNFPVLDEYPFNIPALQDPTTIELRQPVTFFIGENGSGKSTLLRSIAVRCGIHIWQDVERARFRPSKYENEFYRFVSVHWCKGNVPGSFFGSQFHHYFAQSLDEWANSDPGQLNYFGGNSLLSMSHGQSLLAYFQNRYLTKGIYFLDEPETALSPQSQISLVKLIQRMSQAGHAQFLIASHSPILLACPEATIYSLDFQEIKPVEYEETEYFKIYHDFLNNRTGYFE
jgi:predicted ATPase